LRQRRDNASTEDALAKLERAASGTNNLLPYILTAVESYATVGEISNRLRRVWGEYKESVNL
jgi:methylmalonyl-CoA mutase N-terminal domain/subunit